MNEPQILSADGTAICSVEDWHRLAPPKKPVLHWQDRRSAKEETKAWLREDRATLPAQIAALLDGHDLTRGFVCETARPETVVRLEELPPDASPSAQR